MTRLSKEKRDLIILACLGTVAAMVLVVLLLIIPQYHSIARIKTDTGNARKSEQDMENLIKRADSTASELHDLTDTLSNAEGDMAVGDPNAWIYNTIRTFKSHYNVDISVNGQSSIGDVDLFGKFPYKQLKVTVSGTAYFHDLGKFIADLENTYPHTRVTNLMLDPAGSADSKNEKLTFRMDIIALVKPAAT